MKAVIIFLRWGGSAPPDSAFLQGHRVPDGLISQYTKLQTNQEIILVSICILEVARNIFTIFCKSYKYTITKKIFLHSVNVKKSLKTYPLQHKQDAEGIQNMSGVYLIVLVFIK